MDNNILVKKTSYGEEIRQILLDAIMSGELKPGERIVETRWAKKLGVSQAPVREAIKQLESVGLVDNVPFQGAFVSEITVRDVCDAYLVRIQLEELGMHDAVKCVNDDNIIPIENALEEMEKAAKAKDFNTYIDEDVKFHQLIIELSPNKFLRRMWNVFNIREWTVIGTRLSQFDLDELSKRHNAIFNALKNRDEEKLIHESRHHIEVLIEEYLSEEAGN